MIVIDAVIANTFSSGCVATIWNAFCMCTVYWRCALFLMNLSTAYNYRVSVYLRTNTGD